jgi:hypothetical protein
MEELVTVLQEFVDKLSEISDKLDEISSKLDNINGIYGIDDIINKLDEVNNDIRGETGYNLTDIYSQVSEIAFNTSNL